MPKASGRRGGGPLLIKFFGVRGSCPCAGENYLRYGGNTACVAVQVEGAPTVVIDLGTGLRPLGHALEASRVPGEGIEMTALLSHLHWDHIIGLPFCTPLLKEGGRMEIYGPPQEGGSLHDMFDRVVRPPFFPVTMKDIQGNFSFYETGDDDVAMGPIKVKCRLVPHVGNTLGFRLEADGACAAFVFDHQASDDMRSVSASVLELCDGADLVVHDAQYTEGEYKAKSTWGHSTIAYAVHVAAEAGAKTLALFHHDPTHDDDEIDRLVEGARHMAEAGRLEDVIASAEGLEIELRAG